MTEYRMPAKGEGWRHYKDTYPNLYEVVGMAVHTETGKPVVIYKPWGWTLGHEPPLYVRPLEVWLESIPDARGGFRPRFSYERAPAPEVNYPDLLRRYVQRAQFVPPTDDEASDPFLRFSELERQVLQRALLGMPFP